MKKFIFTILILLIATSQTFAYAVKVYDQWGNRIGTYRKEGDNFVLYDFHDKKVENPEDLIKNPPNTKTLTNFTQYFYDENMLPIGSYTTGLWSNTGLYYPRRGRYVPRGFYKPPMGSPSMVRQGANKNNILYEERYPYFKNSSMNKIPLQ